MLTRRSAPDGIPTIVTSEAASLSDSGSMIEARALCAAS